MAIAIETIVKSIIKNINWTRSWFDRNLFKISRLKQPESYLLHYYK